MVFEALSGRLSLDSSSFRRGVERAGSSATTFGSTASGAFDRVGDAAGDSAMRARAAGSGFESLGDSLRNSSIAATLASSRIDEAGDEALTAGGQAAAGAAGFGALSASTDGLRLSMGAISGNIGTVAASVGGLLLVLSPLVPVLGLAAGALGGLAVAFGAILGSGLLAFSEQMGGLEKTVKSLTKQIKPLIVSFGSQFVPLIKSAVSALPGFVKAMLNAVGSLQPFVSALKSLGSAAATILPQIVELMVNVARQALPAFRQIGGFIAANLVPALRALFQAGQQAAGPVARLGMAFVSLGGSLAPIAGIIGRAALSLYDIAAAGVQAAASLTGGFIAGVRQSVTTLAQWATTIRSAVIPVLSALSSAWVGQGARIISVAKGMGTAIMETLGVKLQAAVGVARTAIAGLASIWNTHAQAIIGMAYLLSTNLSEALISGMAAIAAAVQGDMLQMRGMFQQGKAAIQTIWEKMWLQMPASVRAGMSMIAGVVRTKMAQIRTVVTAAQTMWQQHGAAVRRFATTAVGALQRFAAMVRTAIANPLATFERLRAKLNQMLPAFLQIQTTAKQLGNVINSTLIPALGAAGLLGIATKLAPILTGPLLGAFTSISGVALRLAGIFSGPLIGGLTVLLSPLTRIATLAMGTLLPALTSLATTIGGVLVSGLVSLGTTLLSTATAFTSIGSAIALLTGPIGILAAAIAGLYIAWRTNLFGIRDIGMQVFSTIKSLVTGEMGTARTQFQKAVSMIRSSWRKNIQPLIAQARQVFNQIKTVVGNAMSWLNTNAVQPALRQISALWQQHGQRIMTEARNTFNLIKGIVQTGMRATWAVVSGVIGLIMTGWNNFGDEILAATKFIFDLIGKTISFALDTIVTAWSVVNDLLAGNWQAALDEIAGYLSRTFNRMISFVSKWGGGFLRSIGGIIDSVIGFFQDLYNKLIGGSIVPNMFNDIISAAQSFASGMWNKINEMVTSVINSFKQMASDAWNAVNDMASALFNRVSQLASDVWNKIDEMASSVINRVETLASDMLTAGENLIGELISGIQNKIGGVGDAMGSVMDEAKSFLPGSDADEGPLSNLTDAGPALTRTFAMGIEANTRPLERASRKAAAAAKPQPSAGGVGGGGQSTTGNQQQPQNITLQLDGDAVKNLMRGEAVEVTQSEMGELQKDIQAQQTK